MALAFKSCMHATVSFLLQKYFPVLVLGLVASVAYFQASGASALLGVVASPGVAKLRTSALADVRGVAAQRDARALIERNPFDHALRPLVSEKTNAVLTSQPLSNDPLAAPVCDDVSVRIITEADDPLWSTAAVLGQDDEFPRQRRVGDPVGRFRVTFVGFNPKLASPSVWFTSGPELCQAALFEHGQGAAGAGQLGVDAEALARRERVSSVPSRHTLPAEIRDKIKKLSDHEFEIDRSAADWMLMDSERLTAGPRVVPQRVDGRVVGIRLQGIAPETLLDVLGLQNGDLLETVNGFDVTSPAQALEAYARLRSASQLNVTLQRRGQAQSINYRIR